MNRKKNILIALGAIFFSALLVGFIWLLFFNRPDQAPIGNENIRIQTPEVDENKIDQISKLKKYSDESRKNRASGTPSMDILNNDMGQQEPDGEPFLSNDLDPNAVPDVYAHPTSGGNRYGSSFSDPSLPMGNGTGAVPYGDVDRELEELMALQQQFLDQSSSANSVGNTSSIGEINDLLQQLERPTDSTGSFNALGAGQQKPSDPGKPTFANLKEKLMDRLGVTNVFQGAGSIVQQDRELDLLPAETVDQELIFNGSIIAIRSKKDIQLKSPRLFLPAGSVFYGRINFDLDRLMVNIESYKYGDKLYPLQVTVYDYDGREGLQLGNRSWPKIPSKVAKDVYDYAYQRGTQTSTFGGNNEIDMDQAKDIAVLSATKHIGEEVFEKRKVFIPKKYHLWININER